MRTSPHDILCFPQRERHLWMPQHLSFGAPRQKQVLFGLDGLFAQTRRHLAAIALDLALSVVNTRCK